MHYLSSSAHPRAASALKHTRLAIAMQAVLLGSAGLAAWQPLHAAETVAEQSYDLPAAPLEVSLNRFAQQAGITLPFDPALVQNRQAPSLRGQYTPAAALAQLLGDSGLVATQQASGVWTIQALPAQPAATALELDAMTVVSNRLGTISETSGSYTPGSIATATRLVLTPRETPQSITVITRQHMDDFGLNAIDDVMRHTPGITVSTLDSERTSYYSRGFQINNFQYDGIPMTRNSAYSAGNTLSDMAIYDRIEILKGATGLLTGSGDPGATINLIRKKPTHRFQGQLSAGAGSWDNYRAEIDVGGPLTASGNIRGRAVAAHQDRRSFQDHYERSTQVYYGILEADLGPDTLLSIGADYQDNEPEGSSWAAIPIFDSNGNQTDVSRSFNPGARWSSWEQYTRTLFATLEHNFANDWVAKLQLNHQVNGYDAPLASVSSGNPEPATGTGTALYIGKYTGETESDAADFYVSGPFELFGREHELVVGGSIARRHWTGKSYWTLTGYPTDVPDFYDWTGKIPQPTWGSPDALIDETTRERGGYITSRWRITDDLALILGGRVSDYRGETNTETGVLVPYVGAIYDLNDNYSLYASYTSIFKPQSAQDVDGRTLDPLEGDSYEAGLKGEFFAGRLNTSLAYFEIRQDNYAEATNQTTPGGGTAYRAVQGVVTKGFEAELSGELAPGWQAQAGYTHKVARQGGGSKVSTWEPEDQLSFYTTYRLPGSLEPITVGGGARWQSKGWQQVSNPVRGDEDFTQDAYWLVDLMARYQFSENLSATLNVNNLLDEKYFSNVGFYNSFYYGDPRNVMVSTRWSF